MVGIVMLVSRLMDKVYGWILSYKDQNTHVSSGVNYYGLRLTITHPVKQTNGPTGPKNNCQEG